MLEGLLAPLRVVLQRSLADWLIVSSSTSCLPATKPVDGGQGSVMTVASFPFSRKQARPYQVISIGACIVAPMSVVRPG